MTGQYPVRTGITDYLRPDAGKFLDTTYVTLPEALRLNGYHTGIIGKWHLSGYKSGNAPVEVLPDKQGFDEVILSETAGIADGTYFHPYHFNPSVAKKITSEKEFLVERMNLEAAGFIKQNHSKPFFLYLSHYAVHTMVHGQPEVVDHFRNKPGSGKSDPSPNNPENDPYKKWPADYFAKKNNPHLAAQLKVIDDGIGMILDKLAEYGILDNTIIIFTSDNGGESRVTDNHPLRGGKSTLYEGGVREPLIIYQPGKIAGGRVINEIMCTYDFYPTICELTGTAMPRSQKFDGISIAPQLYGKNVAAQSPRAFYWYYPLKERHFLGGRSSSSIRQGDWKLIEFFDNGDKELYNLNEDIGETKNFLSAYPEKAAELQKMLDKWRNEAATK
jgi:arylsulfatase A-like enzyme